MGNAASTLAGRARQLLRAGGGRAGEAELVAGLFGSGANPSRWLGLLHDLLAPLPDVRRAENGDWELVSPPSPPAGRPTELAFVALAMAATSADPWRARLAAISAVRVHGGRLEGVFDAAINPRCRLPRYLTEATGLTEAEVEEAPPFAELADELLEFLHENVLVGLEVRAQLDVLGHELSRLDRPGLGNRLLDLGQLAARMGLKAKPSLPTLAAAVGLTHPRPYRPAVDARVTARLAGRLLALAEARGLARAEALFVRPEREPRGALLQPQPPAAPAGPGVYLLRDAAGRVLYVGKARRLRRRLADYHGRQLGVLRRLEGLAAAAFRIDTIGAASELEALILEARLLRRHEPPYNTQRRAHRPALFLRADLTTDGASLTTCREPASDDAIYLGPFRSARGAAEALRLVRRLFPGLAGRARRRAAERRPLVRAALRFLSGQKGEALDHLRAEQRALAATGDRFALAASHELLRRAIGFTPDIAAGPVHPLDGRLLVLSPAEGGRLLAHLIAGGRLIACFEADDPADARARAGLLGPDRPAADGDEFADEPGIVFRWLCSLGPEHRVEQLGRAGARGQPAGRAR